MELTKSNISELELIVLLKQDAKQGMRILYANYSATLYGVTLKIVKSEEAAKDVLQDAFLKIWKNFSRYDASKGRLFTWILNITRNTAIDYTRSKAFLENQHYYAVKDVPDKKTESKTDQIGILPLLDYLKPEIKLVIETVILKGYTHSEAAEYLEIPLGTVKTRVRNGLIDLRKLVE